MDEILESAYVLAQDQYGNYVIQVGFVCFPKHSVVALSVIKVVTRVMVKAILLIKFVSFLAFCSLAHPLFGEKVSEGFLENS